MISGLRGSPIPTVTECKTQLFQNPAYIVRFNKVIDMTPKDALVCELMLINKCGVYIWLKR